MRIAVAGSSGLIGTALCARLEARGDVVVRLVRRPPSPGEAQWDPVSGSIDSAALDGVHAAVNLSGAGIGDRRWTEARRVAIVSSRLQSTSLLARTLARLRPRPTVLVNASAIGIYGDRGDEALTEESQPGTGFLAELCQAWEQATVPAADAEIRVVCLRSGVVLSASGGALARQLPLLRLGVGGRLGHGRQWTSWISLADETRAIVHLLDDARLSGAVNATAPQPVTNRDLTRALGRALHRPTALSVPRFALRAALGRGLADEVALASQRVLPARLTDAGFTFRHPEIDGALTELLGRR
jgi:uncharacterized protein